MNPIDYLLVAVLMLILGAAAFFIHRSRKKGRKCIGCPDSCSCSGQCPGCTGKK